MENRTLSPTPGPFARRMKFRNILPLLAFVFALSACEEPSAVAVDVEPALLGGRVMLSATGNSIVTATIPGLTFPRYFTFTARRHADGSVAGQWERVNRRPHEFGGGLIEQQGIVLCMTRSGNQVWIGTLTVGGPDDGRERGFRAEDNGEGPNAPPDRISGHRTFTGFSAADFCENQTPPFLLFDITSPPDPGGGPNPGQIQVRP